MSADVLEAVRKLPEVAEAELGDGTLWVAPATALADGGAALLQSVWHSAFEKIFSGPASTDDPTLHDAVWGSSYTGTPIPIAQIRRWVAATVANVVALEPRRVLEVGCGDGQILRGVLPHCQSYVGTDLSPAAIAGLRASLSSAEGARVELLCLGALELGTVTGPFDTIVINSVCQYFPSYRYLWRVLDAAYALLAPGGCLYLGDVRSLRGRAELAASIEWTHAPDATVATWRTATRRRLVNDNELLLDPAVAFALARRFGQAQLTVKRGWDDNELVDFRFDLVARREPAPRSAAAPVVVEWMSCGSLAALRTLLSTEAADWVVVRAVPNPRLIDKVARLARLAQAPHDARLVDVPLAPPADEGVHPEDLVALGEATGRRAIVGWSGVAGCLDAFFSRPGAPSLAVAGVVAADPEPALASLPGFGRVAARLRRRVGEPLGPLGVDLPVVVLERLPRTPDGALDLAAARAAWVMVPFERA